MEWKCSKCGMPNFDDNVCKLCGAERSEEIIENTETTETEAAEPTFEPVVIEYGPEEEAVPVLEETSFAGEVPEPEIEVFENPEEPVCEEEPEIAEEVEVPEPETEEEEAKAEPEEDVPVAEEPVVPVVPGPETKSKKRSKLPAVLLIWLLIIAAAAYYLFVLKGDFVNNESQEPTSVPAISQSTEPSAEPSIEPEILEEVPAPEETADASETPIESEPPVEIITPSAPAETPAVTPVKTPAPTKKPTPAPKVTKKYKIYTSNDYSFYAAYPVDFSEKANLHNESLMHLASYEDKVDMVIGGTKNWNKLTAKEALKKFLGFFNGTVLESSSGDNWYTATINEDGRVTRRKAFVKDGNICYVEFTYLENDEAEFLPCMNYVLENFITMK